MADDYEVMNPDPLHLKLMVQPPDKDMATRQDTKGKNTVET